MNPIVVGELAVAVLLLCGAGLLVRTMAALGDVDPGYRADNVLTMGLGPGMSNDPVRMLQFYQAVEREVRAAPGVRNVAWGSALPLDGLWCGQSFEIEGDPDNLSANREGAGYQIVSPTSFDLLRVPIV